MLGLVVTIASVTAALAQNFPMMGRFGQGIGLTNRVRYCNSQVCVWNCPDQNGNDCEGLYVCGNNCHECHFKCEKNSCRNVHLISNCKNTYAKCMDEDTCKDGLTVETDVGQINTLPGAQGMGQGQGQGQGWGQPAPGFPAAGVPAVLPRAANHMQEVLYVLCAEKACEKINVKCNGRVKSCTINGMQNWGSGEGIKHSTLICQQSVNKSVCNVHCGDINPTITYEHPSCDAVRLLCAGSSSCTCCGNACAYGMFPVVPTKPMLRCPLTWTPPP